MRATIEAAIESHNIIHYRNLKSCQTPATVSQALDETPQVQAASAFREPAMERELASNRFFFQRQCPRGIVSFMPLSVWLGRSAFR
ncbi:MAG: hypothetical protein QM770_16365 [Tepidisphaeraceae bacterium]